MLFGHSDLYTSRYDEVDLRNRNILEIGGICSEQLTVSSIQSEAAAKLQHKDKKGGNPRYQ